ncbi:GntR family transcriptional regulator [Paracoccaceae bacterium Fryx2]|nr:GntR family transcriptional regulator [Paracoccaceae bacterium Fryx2]
MPDEHADPGTTHSFEPVYHALRRAIMCGDIMPGERMVVKRLSERFHTSALPVRQALQRLVAEGALIDRPYYGAEVPVLDVEAVMDLRRVRCALEGQAAEWAAQTITPTALDQLHQLQARMQATTDPAHAEAYLAWNLEFHFTVYKAAGSPLILPLIESLWLRVGPCLNVMRTETTLGLGLDHHDDVLAALTRGDGTAARAAVVAELTEAAEVMARSLRSYTPDPALRRRSGRSRAE